MRSCLATVVGVTILASSCLFSPPAQAGPVEVRVKPLENTPVHVELLQVEPRLGQDIELFFRIQNLSSERLDTVEVQVEQRNARGRVRAYHSFTRSAGLEPGGEFFLMHRTQNLKPREGDLFVVQVVPGLNPFGPGQSDDSEATNGLIQKQYPFRGCTTFCDSCAEKAASLCGSGVSEYSCSCTESSSSCSFTCAV